MNREAKPAFPLFKENGPVRLCSSDMRALLDSGLFEKHLEDLSKDSSLMREAPHITALVSFCMKTMENIKLPEDLKSKLSTDELVLLYMGLSMLQGLQVGIVIGAANEAGSIQVVENKQEIDLESMPVTSKHIV